jgi:hypothetical protein
MFIEIVGEERHFYRAEREGGGHLIRVWTMAEGCGPLCAKGKTQLIERKDSIPVSKQKAKKKPWKKWEKIQKAKAKEAELNQSSCREECRFHNEPTSVKEKQIWALVELLARTLPRSRTTGDSYWGVTSIGFWSAWDLYDVENEDFEEVFFKNHPLGGNSEDRPQSSISC